MISLRMLQVLPKLFSVYSAKFIKGIGMFFHLSICSWFFRYKSGILYSGKSLIRLSNWQVSITCSRSMSPLIDTCDGADCFYYRDAPLLPLETREVDLFTPNLFEECSSSIMSSLFGWIRSSLVFCWSSNFEILLRWLRVANSDFASDASFVPLFGVLSFFPSALFIFLCSWPTSVVEGLISSYSTSEGSTT